MFSNLKAEMAKKGIRVIDISIMLGCSEKTVRNYINGETKITLFDALRIQKELFPEYEVLYLFKFNESNKE